MSDELQWLYHSDQADRQGGLLPADLAGRDSDRRQRVRGLLQQGLVRAASDRFHAAMVLQRSPDPSDHLLAYRLAAHAAQVGYRPARWLAAAAYDRWLVRTGHAQRYGTQYYIDDSDIDRPRWALEPVDPATTDTERAHWDVPPLAAARQWAEQLNRRRRPVHTVELIAVEQPECSSTHNRPWPLGQLRAEFDGDHGHLRCPYGHDHRVSLEPWRDADAHATHLELICTWAWHSTEGHPDLPE